MSKKSVFFCISVLEFLTRWPLPFFCQRCWQKLKGLANNEAPVLAALTYGPCVLTTEVQGVGVTITQETTYPFADSVRLTVMTEWPLPLTLYLRKPAWAKTAVTPNSQHNQQTADSLIFQRNQQTAVLPISHRKQRPASAPFAG